MAENTFGVISSALMKTVHVELSDKGVHFAVSEIFGEDQLLELIDIFDDEFCAGWSPI